MYFIYFRIEFPPCVQWFTIEFDPQSGTAQPEDNLLISIPKHPKSRTTTYNIDRFAMGITADDGTSGSQNNGICRNANITTSTQSVKESGHSSSDDWYVAQIFNT